MGAWGATGTTQNDPKQRRADLSTRRSVDALDQNALDQKGQPIGCPVARTVSLVEATPETVLHATGERTGPAGACAAGRARPSRPVLAARDRGPGHGEHHAGEHHDKPEDRQDGETPIIVALKATPATSRASPSTNSPTP